MLTIARNGCIDHKRRQKETITLEEFHHSLPQVQESDQQELLRLIELALEYLEFDLKEVFVLRQYQELSYEEIALLTGVPVTTVTKRIWRAKERLKKILSPFIRDLAQF